MNHLVYVLKGALNQEKLRVSDERTISLIKFRINDGIGDAGLVLDRKKDEAMGGARALSGNDTTSDSGLLSRCT
jgi:hypothetical protein